MKKTIVFALLPMLLVSFIGLNSCKSNSSSKDQKKIEMEQVKIIEGEIATNVYPLPTSADVIKMLTDYEIGYIFGISNPVSNVSSYISSSARAINLGIYGGDLSYATLYNMQQEIINYMDAIRVLANELNMSQIYDESLYEKIKNNFDNRDELVTILTGAFNETYDYLSKNDQQALALLVVGGAWVEGMYLTTHVSEAAYNIVGISENLLKQKSSFDLFIEISQPHASDPAIADFLQKLNPIKEVYSTLTTSLTEQNIKDITAAIESVRSQVVQ